MIRESHELGWCFINALFEATIKIPAFFSQTYFGQARIQRCSLGRICLARSATVTSAVI
jgi:hypothetical protein